MNNKIFIDSSILIEYYKGTKYGIEALASHDSDFAVACKSEAIWLLSSEEDFVQFKART